MIICGKHVNKIFLGRGESLNKRKGKRRRERIEIKGNPYAYLMNYPMNEVKEKIIYFLYDMRVATTSQIARYLNLSKDYTRKLLKELYENRLVYRDFPSIKKGKYGSGEGVYFLDNQGAFFIAADKGIEKREVNWDPRDNVVSLGAVKHSLDITEIRTCMEEQSKEIKVEEFFGERQVGRIDFICEGEELSFNPDGRISLIKKLDKKVARITFFLEYDRNTETINTFMEKIRIYEKFYRTGKLNQLFGNVHPAILVISNNENRTKRLKEVIDENKVENIKYYFDTLDKEFMKNPFRFLND